MELVNQGEIMGSQESTNKKHVYYWRKCFIPGGPQKTEQSIQSIFQDFALINIYLFFTLLGRASFTHYNNTKIIKFGWELYILWVISYGLSFLGSARFPEFRGMINDKLMANPENESIRNYS